MCSDWEGAEDGKSGAVHRSETILMRMWESTRRLSVEIVLRTWPMIRLGISRERPLFDWVAQLRESSLDGSRTLVVKASVL